MNSNTSSDDASIGTIAIQTKKDSQTATSLSTSNVTIVIRNSNGDSYNKVDGTVESGVITFAQNGNEAPDAGTYTANITESDSGLEIGTVTITLTSNEDEASVLKDAAIIKAALEGVTAEGTTFTIPEEYRAEVDEMTNGSSASGPDVHTSSRWKYDDNNYKFTVESAEDEDYATAEWTVTKGDYQATVTLTLTGKNGEAGYTRTVEVTVEPQEGEGGEGSGTMP